MSYLVASLSCAELGTAQPQLVSIMSESFVIKHSGKHNLKHILCKHGLTLTYGVDISSNNV